MKLSLLLSACGIFFFSLKTQAVCLRFPGTPPSALKKMNCDFQMESALTLFLAEASADKSYDSLLQGLERGENRKNAWSKFIQDFSQKSWTQEDRQMLVDISQSLREQNDEIAADQRLFRFGDYRELQMADHPGVKALQARSGWEDLQIRVLSLEEETTESILKTESQHHWILASSVFQPVFHWGTLSSALAEGARASRAWLQGSCTDPKWLGGLQASAEKIRAFEKDVGESCEISSPGRRQNPNPGKVSLDMGFTKTEFNGLELPKPLGPSLTKDRPISGWWIAFGVIALGAYAMKDKKVVITRGSF